MVTHILLADDHKIFSDSLSKTKFFEFAGLGTLFGLPMHEFGDARDALGQSISSLAN